MPGKILRLGRIIISLCVFGSLTCGLSCSALVIPGIEPWLERLQIGPAVLHFTLVIFIAWLLVTLTFGRIYCSTFCPLGTMMDIMARSVRPGRIDKLGSSRFRYRYSHPANRLRFYALGIILASALLGNFILPSITEPFSVFSRICNSLLAPLFSAVSNGLTLIGITSTAPAVMVTASLLATSIAMLLFVALFFMSAKSGRLYCNTICPIGTALGCVSRFAIYQMDIDTDLCINCGKCEDACKASCIDLRDHLVDSSRCVVCFDCQAVCPNNAIRLTRNRKQLSTPLLQRIGMPGRQPEASLDCKSSCIQSKLNETISSTPQGNSRERD